MRLFYVLVVVAPLGFAAVWWASRDGESPVATGTTEPPVAPAPKTKPAEKGAPAPLRPEQTAALPNPTESEQMDSAAGPHAALEPKGAPAAQTPAPPPATKLYRRVTVRDAGSLQADGAVIRLAGIAARAADATCKDAAGKTWRCGAAAKAALAKLIRTRAVTCTLPKSGEEKSFIARCSVGGTDLSTWVLRQGWAEPQDANEAPLAAAASAARQERLGLWRAGD